MASALLKPRFLLLSLVLVGMVACTSSVDAVVFNPCAETATVSHGNPESQQWFDETQVQPEGAAVLKAYVMKDGDFIRVQFAGREVGVLETVPTGKEGVPSEGPVPILIPSEMCP